MLIHVHQNVVTTIFLIFTSFLLMSWFKSKELGEDEFFDKLWDGKKFKIQERICRDENIEKTCNYVVDFITKLENGSYIAARGLTPNNEIGFSWNGLCFLRIPDQKTSNNLDSKKWRLMNEFLGADTLNFHFVVSTYQTGLIDFSENSKINVLNLGIATGSLQTFIGKRYPLMNVTGVDIDETTEKLTTEWFDMPITDHNRIVIQDAIEFVKEEAEKNQKYDLILTDVCLNHITHDTWICPIDAIHEHSFLKNVRKILKDDGVVAFNALYVGSHKKYDEFKQKLLNYFNYCDRKPHYSNTLFTCYSKPSPKRPSEEETQHFSDSIGVEKIIYKFAMSMREKVAKL